MHAVLRKRGHPNADGDVHLSRIQLHRMLPQPARQIARAIKAHLLVAICQQHNKLITTQPRGHITAAQLRRHHPRQFPQHLAATGVAVLRVELLEVVQVNEQQRVGTALAAGAFSDAAEHIAVGVTVSRSNITVEVRNPISARQTDTLSRLYGMIQWIRGFQDPFEAYLERLKEVSAQTVESHESGLGLVRIAYEGRSVLDYFINDKNVLAMSAVHPL